MRIIRKLRHIIDSKIPEYLFKRYPKLIDFIHGFIDFLDEECAIEAMNITDNLNPDTIVDRFLNDYFDQYCANLIDTNKYQLTNENKRLFLRIAKFLYNQKGKKFSFDVALKYLTQFFAYDEDSFFEEIDYEIIENASYWASTTTLEHEKPYTYTFEGDFRRSLIVALIEKLNPVGFYPEFIIRLGDDDWIETYPIDDNVTEESDIRATPAADIIHDESTLRDGVDSNTMWETATMDKAPGTADEAFWAGIAWEDFSLYWLRLTTSSASGTYTSKVKDLGTYFSIRVVPTIRKLLMTGTSASISIRHSEDNVTWSSWVSAEVDVITSARYLQWKADLATADTSKTPFVIKMIATIQAYETF
jgi:hypothetical protein